MMTLSPKTNAYLAALALTTAAMQPIAAVAPVPYCTPAGSDPADAANARNEMQACLWQQHSAAVANASALGDMFEGRRPNSFVGLNTATPLTAIGAGASTGTMSVSLPANSEIVTFSVNDADAADFTLNSLQVNGWEWNKGGAAANLSMLQSVTERYNAPAPLR